MVRLEIEGHHRSITSMFENPDGTLSVIVGNALDRVQTFMFTGPQDLDRNVTADLAPRSFNTLPR